MTASLFLTPFTFNEPDPSNLVRITDTGDIQEFVGNGISGDNSSARPTDASRGVVIGALGLPWLHACEGSPLDDVRETPAEFLDDLHNLGGLTTDSVTATTLDGHDALTTAFRAGASRCTPDFHVTYDDTHASKAISVSVASQLTVLTVGGTTIVVDAWAQSDDSLQAWLPTALDFVDSIHFLDKPARTVDPGARDFLGYLHGYAQAFTPNDPPTEAADWHDAVQNFPFAGAEVETAQYGTVTCLNPDQGLRGTCALGQPGHPLNIWLVTFADVPAFQGCPVWASVNAETGDFINGSGPQC